MKPEIFNYICDAIGAAKIIGADGMVFNENGAYACDESITAMMIQPSNYDLDFATLALTDVSGFLSRVALFNDKKPNVTEIIDNGSKAVRMVNMKAGRTKVDYQCCLPAMVQVPKKLNDEFIANVQLDEETVGLIQKALQVMRSEHVYIISNDEGVSVEISAINNDIFKHRLEHEIEIPDGGDARFIHKYPAKMVLALFRKSPTAIIQFGKRGTLNIVVDDFNFYMLPQQ